MANQLPNLQRECRHHRPLLCCMEDARDKSKICDKQSCVGYAERLSAPLWVRYTENTHTHTHTHTHSLFPHATDTHTHTHTHTLSFHMPQTHTHARNTG